MIEVNGKVYPLWNQFIDKKDEFIGGILEDHDSSPFESIKDSIATEITDIRLSPNGVDSAFFKVCGKDFSCGFDVKVGGIDGSISDTGEGWLGFCGYGGHQWRIKKQKK